MRLSFAATVVALSFSNALTTTASPIGTPPSERAADLSQLTRITGLVANSRRADNGTASSGNGTAPSQSGSGSTSVGNVGLPVNLNAPMAANAPAGVNLPKPSRRDVKGDLLNLAGNINLRPVHRLATLNAADIHARAGSLSLTNISARAVRRAGSIDINNITARAPFVQEEEDGAQELSEKHLKSVQHRVADSRDPESEYERYRSELSRRNDAHADSPEVEPSVRDFFRGYHRYGDSEPGFEGEKYRKREATSEVAPQPEIRGPEAAPPSADSKALHQGFIKNADYEAVPSPTPAAAAAATPATSTAKVLA